MASSVMLPSFAGGELSTSLYARVDLDKYHSGASLLRNMFVDYRGGVTNRPGLEFIYTFAAGKTVRILPFIVSRDQSYIVAFEADGSGSTLRLFLNDGYIGSVSGPWLDSEIFDIRFAQSADVMTLVHPSHVPYNLSRTALTTFTLAAVTFGPTIAPPATNPTCTPTVSGTALSYCYCVTALDKDGGESLASNPTEVGSKILDPSAATPVTISLTWPSVTGAVGYNVYKAGPVNAADAMPTVYGYIGNTKIPYFTDNNIGQDYSRTPPEHRDPFSPGQIIAINVTAAGTGMVDDYEPVVITGDGTGAVAYVAAKGVAGLAAGAVIVNGGINYTTATAAPTTGTATFSVTLDANNRYPACVTYFQQRRCYAGSDYAPDLIEMSRTGQYSNFDVSPSVADSDAITINIASREVNTIQHMIPMSTGLVVFTKGNAFLLSGGGGSGPVSPTNISATSQASTGAGSLRPLIINYNILFNQYEGTVVRDMAFQWQTNSYYGADRSMLSNHLFSGHDLVDWDFAMEPLRLVWAVRSDGIALSMTYVPEQEVYGWAQHATEGRFKSVAAIPSGRQDDVYFIVERLVGGVWTSKLEKLFRHNECARDARFLDAAVQLPVTPGTTELRVTVTGLTLTAVIPASLVPITTATPGTVGSYCLDLGCAGHAMITSIVVSGPNATITATLAEPLDPIPGTNIYPNFPAGDWGIGTYQTSMIVPSLAGQTVQVVVDGVPTGSFQVVNQPSVYTGFSMLNHPDIVNAWNGACVGVDWVRRKAFMFETGGSTRHIVAINLDTQLQVASAVQPVDHWSWAGGLVDGNGYVYSTGGPAALTLFKYDPNTLGIAGSFGSAGSGGSTNLTTLAIPACQCIVQSGGKNYMLQTASIAEITTINVDTMAWTGWSNTTIEGHGQVCAGPPGTSTGYAGTKDGPATSLKFYKIVLDGSGVGTLTLIATVLATNINAAFTSFTIYGMFCDESDGNICFLIGGPGGFNLCKLNATTGAIVWSTALNTLDAGMASYQGNRNRIRNGKIVFLVNAPRKFLTVDLATGTLTTLFTCVNFASNDGVQLFDDVHNTFIGSANWSGPPTTPPELPGTPNNSPTGHELMILDAGPGSKITWALPSCNVYAGIPYCSEFATLRLDTGEPTIQGRRKMIPAVTLRVKDSVGFKVGTTDFNTMIQPKADLGGAPGANGYVPWSSPADGVPVPFSGDIRVNVYAGWERAGIITVEQCTPFPLTILGLIPEVTLGDTQR